MNEQVTGVPQSIIDEVSDQTKLPKSEKDEQVGKKKFTIALPHITVESFYDRKHLKRRVKLITGLYIIIFMGVTLFFILRFYGQNADSQRKWSTLQQQYLGPLLAINIAELSNDKQRLYSGFQETREPIYILYLVELIASESNVQLENPSYVIDTREVVGGVGVRIASLATGSVDQIKTFIQKIYELKPLMQLQVFDVFPSDVNDGYRVALEIHVATVPPIDEAIETIEGKEKQKVTITYPSADIEEFLTEMDALQTAPFEGIGQSVLGKENLFN